MISSRREIGRDGGPTDQPYEFSDIVMKNRTGNKEVFTYCLRVILVAGIA
jgi:hypothetical protein